MTLYAHWWGKWKITEEPTLTETGKAVRSLDGYPNVTDEVILPNLSNTDVWERRVYIEPDEYTEGLEKYTSDYGYVWINTPKIPLTNNKIEYADNSIYITVIKDGNYYIIYTTSDTTRKLGIRSVPAGVRLDVGYPPNFNPSGEVTATLYDSEDNELCSVTYKV